MKLDNKLSCKISVRWSKGKYNSYLMAFLFLFSLYPLSKTVLDLSMLLITGRIVGTEDWIAPTYAHKERLALSTPNGQQRILIVGGSSALFGISAQQISEATGVQAINLATHAGLGGSYILGRAEKLIRPGDIVVLPIEYAMYLRSDIAYDFKIRDTLSRFIISYDRAMLRQIPISSILRFIFENAFSMGAFSDASRRQYQEFLGGELTQETIAQRLQDRGRNGDCYNGRTLNEYGDETCTFGKDDEPTPPMVIDTAIAPSMVNIDPSGYIQEFVTSVHEKGATIVPLYPASVYTQDYENPAFQRSAENIANFWQSQGIDFQDSLERSLLTPDLMYDTRYHPKDSGRRQRTEVVISILQNNLAKNKDSELTKSEF